MLRHVCVSLVVLLSIAAVAVRGVDHHDDVDDDECDYMDGDIDAHLATKTPYRFVANADVSPVEYDGCQASRIWSLVRHGTRRPNRRIVRSMYDRLQTVRDEIVNGGWTTLCERDRQRFEQWSTNELRENEEMQLTEEGHDELVRLAERVQNRFQHLMPDVYRNESYRFKFTDSQRTRKSFEAFATGLFGRNNIRNIWHPAPSKRDPILRFYKMCDRWSRDVDKNPNALVDVEAFRQSPTVEWAVRTVSQKAGIAKLLSTSEVHLMYTLCAFETAWDRLGTSPWCALFDEHTASVFEYLEDLEYYLIDGYGSPLTYRQACPALNDMLDRLTDDRQPAATFYFTHSGTMLKVLALLGLYRDAEPLSRAGFESQVDRRWRTSRIDAFASNLAFVMYNCSGTSHLLVQHQERTVRLDGCPTDSDLCPLAQFRSVYRHSLAENCRFDEMCAIAVTPNPEL